MKKGWSGPICSYCSCCALQRVHSISNQADLKTAATPRPTLCGPLIDPNLTDEVAEPLPAHPAVVAVPRPVDQERLAAHGIEIDVTPKSTIVAAVAVVAHDKDMVLGYGFGTEFVAAAGAPRLGIVAGEVRMRIVHRLAVDIDLLRPYFDRITRHGDHPLDKVLRLVLGKYEHHHVTAIRPGVIDQIFFQERQADAVGELVDQDMVTDLQRRNHRSGGNLERLDDKGPDEQRQDQRHDDRFGVLAESRFALHRSRTVHRRCLFNFIRLFRRHWQPLIYTLSAAKNASWGISTLPTCFILFLPSFCRSNNLRLRVMSPP